MRVIPIPAHSDNYQYLVIDEKTNVAAIIDPSHMKSIIEVVAVEHCQLTTALVTHHHWDHAAATQSFSDPTVATVVGIGMAEPFRIYAGESERIIGVTEVVEDGDSLAIGSLRVSVIATPCHTSSHVCYLIEDSMKGERAVFTGDTLFVGGCGRFFEGTAEQMNKALNVRLASLPGDTLVYCGHEYTVSNMKFAEVVEPKNSAVRKKLAWAEAEVKANRYTVPSTIAAEKKYNVFMRVKEPSIQKWLGVTDPIEAMQKLREMKNRHRGLGY